MTDNKLQGLYRKSLERVAKCYPSRFNKSYKGNRIPQRECFKNEKNPELAWEAAVYKDMKRIKKEN